MKKLLLILIICCLSACVPHAVREAHEVVAQADSLWQAGQMYGIDAGDSVTLAQAYETLKEYSAFSSFVHGTSSLGTFSHACYHYGRLLRAKDDPVAAMECFIAATHSHTRDYHILGRVYSNMGDICHLAGEFQLSYDMFERSANSFLQGGDTTAYYYALNDMAFELAEQGKKEETLALLRKIEGSNQSDDFSEAVLITKILLAIRAKQYKDVIDLVDKICIPSAYNPTIMIAKAQAYYYLQSYDSAAHYAQEVLDKTKSPFDKDNAYYILIHCDSVQHGNRVYTLSADRADTEKEIEERHGKLTQAVQLLEQDMARKRDLRWIFMALGCLCLICTALLLSYIRKKHHLLQEQNTNYIDKKRKDMEITCSNLRTNKNIKKELDWDNYESMCTIINVRFGGLQEKLTSIPNITPNDVRICVLCLINLSYAEIAELLNISPKSIAKLKSITAHKLGTTMRDLRTTLFQIACEMNRPKASIK